jgi:hypothetical protein
MLVAAPVVILACSIRAVAADAPPEPHIAATARASLERALRGPTVFDFADTPLSDVVDYLANKHDIVMILDNKGLTDAAIDPSSPVTKSIRKPIRLASGLKLILEEFDLTYTIKDDVLLITTKEKADEVLIMNTYDVADLLDRGSSSRAAMTQLIEAITSVVHPDSWDENGGPGSIVPFGEVLVVSQRADVHENITDLLSRLRSVPPKKTDRLSTNVSGSSEVTSDEFRVVAYTLQRISNEDATKAISTLVAPESWSTQGGDGSLCAVTWIPYDVAGDAPPHLSHRIIAIRQTPEVHVEVRKVLQKLEGRVLVGMGQSFVWGPCALGIQDVGQPVNPIAAPGN